MKVEEKKHKFTYNWFFNAQRDERKILLLRIVLCLKYDPAVIRLGNAIKAHNSSITKRSLSLFYSALRQTIIFVDSSIPNIVDIFGWKQGGYCTRFFR